MSQKVIKITTPYADWPLVRQTPGGKGVWEDCNFYVNDDSIKECDYWIVCEGLQEKETVTCSEKNTVFFAWEPPSVKKYNHQFLNQFHRVVSSDKDIDHSNLIFSQQGLPWMVGARFLKNRTWDSFKNYDYFNINDIPPKNKLLSVILSNKNFTEGHRLKVAFVEQLKIHFKEAIDIYGVGFKEIPDKWDAIAPYKYHIVLENSTFENYWTEKLSDAYLGNTFPVYYGCVNILNYFSKNSLEIIDISKPKAAIETIENLINNDFYEKRAPSIAGAKKLILNKYNIFPVIRQIIMSDGHNTEKRQITLLPALDFEKHTKKKQNSKILQFIKKKLKLLIK